MYRKIIRRIAYAMPVYNVFVQYGLGFIVAHKLTTLGCEGWRVMLPTLGWGISYSCASLIVGRRVTDKNVHHYIQLASLGYICVALIVYLSNTYAILAMCRPVDGIFAATFAVPAQLLIKRLKTWSLSRGSSALKTASTCIVMSSLGVIASTAICANIGLNTSLVIMITLGVVMMIFPAYVSYLYPKANDAPVIEQNGVKLENSEEPAGPNLIVLAWIVAGVLSFCISMSYPAVAFRSVCVGLNEKVSGNALALIGVTGCVTVLVLSRLRNWMYRMYSIFGMFMPLLGGLMLFAISTVPRGFYVAGTLLGITYGCILSYATFHSLAHSGHEGKYASIKEFIMGVTALLGPAVGMTATRAVSSRPFFIAGGIVLACFAAVLVMYERAVKKVC